MNTNSFALILLLAILLMISSIFMMKKNRENFRKCICSEDQGGRERECQDTVVVNNLYVTGELTESSKLKSHGWSKVSPGDVDFPLSSGCDWPNANTGKGWTSWDFTDFGS